jgi:hypothetical protein
VLPDGSPVREALAAALDIYGPLDVLLTLGNLIELSAVQLCSSLAQVPELARDLIILAGKYRPLESLADDGSLTPL